MLFYGATQSPSLFITSLLLGGSSARNAHKLDRLYRKTIWMMIIATMLMLAPAPSFMLIDLCE
jgi:hypothetical protein